MREEEQVGFRVACFSIVDDSLPSDICGQPGLLKTMVVACLPVKFPTLGLEGVLLRRVTKGPSVQLCSLEWFPQTPGLLRGWQPHSLCHITPFEDHPQSPW